MILIYKADSCDYMTDEMADLVRGLAIDDAYVEIANYLEARQPCTMVIKGNKYITLRSPVDLMAVFRKGTTCRNPDCPHEVHEFYEGSLLCKKCTIERTRLRQLKDRRDTVEAKLKYLKTVLVDQRASTVFNWVKKGKIDSSQFKELMEAVCWKLLM